MTMVAKTRLTFHRNFENRTAVIWKLQNVNRWIFKNYFKNVFSEQNKPTYMTQRYLKKRFRSLTKLKHILLACKCTCTRDKSIVRSEKILKKS